MSSMSWSWLLSVCSSLMALPKDCEALRQALHLLMSSTTFGSGSPWRLPTWGGTTGCPGAPWRAGGVGRAGQLGDMFESDHFQFLGLGWVCQPSLGHGWGFRDSSEFYRHQEGMILRESAAEESKHIQLLRALVVET